MKGQIALIRVLLLNEGTVGNTHRLRIIFPFAGSVLVCGLEQLLL
jgi:hypothetical protein